MELIFIKAKKMKDLYLMSRFPSRPESGLERLGYEADLALESDTLL